VKLEAVLKRNKKLLIIATAFLVLFIAVSPFAIVNPGWEIYNQVNAMQYPEGVKSGAGEFTSPATISGSTWIVDTDDPNYGVPTIEVQTSDIRHVDFSGKPVADTTPATVPKEFVRGNHSFVLDYHVYMFDMTIRTVADKAVTTFGGWYPSTRWMHETSWPYTGYAVGMNPDDDPLVGKQFVGGVYVKFVISPWKGTGVVETPENYSLNTAWAGVMNSYIFTKEQGQVANQWGDLISPSNEAPLFVRGGLDNGAQVPMFLDDGTYGSVAPVVDWDLTASPDSRIKSAVVLYLPVQLQAGAYLTRNWASTVTQLTPCDAYIKYTIRVDVLTTHDFVLQTAVNPPELNPPVDIISWFYGFWDSPATQATLILLALALFALLFFYVFLKYRRAKT
jgi:hypothetical protein